MELRIRERRVVPERPSGRRRHRGVRPTHLVERLELILQRLRRLVERAHGVEHAEPPAVGARAVVARDVDDQGVVQHAHVFDGLHDTADLVVGQLGKRREELLIADRDLFLVGGQRVPVRRNVGLGRELGVLRDDAKFLLAGQNLLAVLVPAHVELALVLVPPRFGELNRIMHALGRVVDKERLVGIQGLLCLDPLDRTIGEIGLIVVVRILRRRGERRVVVGHRRELVRFADHVAIELLEPEARGPLVERPREAAFPRHIFVRLAEHRRAVAVEPQDLGEGRHAVRQDGSLTRKARRHFRDRAHVRAVRIAAGEQCHAARRADRRGMEIVVGQSVLGEALEGRQVHHATERRGAGVAEIVEQDDHDIGRARRRLDLEDRRRLRIAGVELGDRRTRRFRDWQHGAVDVRTSHPASRSASALRSAPALTGRRPRPSSVVRPSPERKCPSPRASSTSPIHDPVWRPVHLTSTAAVFSGPVNLNGAGSSAVQACSKPPILSSSSRSFVSEGATASRGLSKMRSGTRTSSSRCGHES